MIQRIVILILAMAIPALHARGQTPPLEPYHHGESVEAFHDDSKELAQEPLGLDGLDYSRRAGNNPSRNVQTRTHDRSLQIAIGKRGP